MNLEPNKHPTKVRKKTPTNNSHAKPSVLPTSSTSNFRTKDKNFENFRKNSTAHQNNFENFHAITNRSNINSKSSSKIATSREKKPSFPKEEAAFANNIHDKKPANFSNPIEITTKNSRNLNNQTTFNPYKKKTVEGNQLKPAKNPQNFQNSREISKRSSSNTSAYNVITRKTQQISKVSQKFLNENDVYTEYYNNKNYTNLENNNANSIKSWEFKPQPKELYDSVVISEEEPILECEESIEIEEKKPENKGKREKHCVFEEKKADGFDSNTLNYLICQEGRYQPDAFYLQRGQNHINSLMRTILMDWMMEVCSEFTLKRETFHLAVNYVDRYLSKVKHVEKNKLQLIGLCAMYVAAKIEEIYAPKIVDFMKSADNAFHMEEIKKTELNLLLNLKYFLNPPTLNMWANWYMNQWDLYIENKENFSPFNPPLKLIQFKAPNEKSYLLFREFMQILDNILLDIETLQYKPRALVGSLMYLILGKDLQEFSLQQIIDDFPYTSNYLINNRISFNFAFSKFLTFCFGFELFELLPTIQFVATFFALPILNNLPIAAKLNKENVLESHFEEFLAFQTHNKYNIENVKKRRKI